MSTIGNSNDEGIKGSNPKWIKCGVIVMISLLLIVFIGLGFFFGNLGNLQKKVDENATVTAKQQLELGQQSKLELQNLSVQTSQQIAQTSQQIAQIDEIIRTQDFGVQTKDLNNNTYVWNFSNACKNATTTDKDGKQKDASAFFCIKVISTDVSGNKTDTNILCLDPNDPKDFTKKINCPAPAP